VIIAPISLTASMYGMTEYKIATSAFPPADA
jgi:hypothetical protein